jgi:DNA repair protein RecO (recombination protein O)
MKQIVTQGIVLRRTDFGEADRILNFLTPDHGKVAGIAKGVRKSKSKLAGGIELFSVSELSFIVGKSDIYTITSARLVKHYDNIVKDLNRTNPGYEFIRVLNKATEDNPEPAYFTLLTNVFEALDDLELDPSVTNLWFNMQLLKLAGHTPNLKTDTKGNKLELEVTYDFDFDRMQFTQKEQGKFNANHIKFLRLGFAAAKPQILHQVQDCQKISGEVSPLIQAILQNFVRT